MRKKNKPFCYARVLVGTAFCLRKISYIKDEEIRGFFKENGFKGALLPKVECVEKEDNPKSAKAQRNINAWEFLKVALGHPEINTNPRGDFETLMEKFFDYTSVADHCISIKNDRTDEAREIFEEDPEIFILAATLLLEKQIKHLKRKAEDPEYTRCEYGLVFLVDIE